jgi:hypothetical protein
MPGQEADMTSDHTTNPDHVNAHDVANCDGLARLSLKPSSSARGTVDGAWWPRSRDPAIELAALIEELSAQRTPVRGITLHRVGWDSAPRRIALTSGRKVAVDWFRSGDLRTIQIIDANYQRIDLFIIPVDTTPALADLALTMATNGQDPHIIATGTGAVLRPDALQSTPRHPRPTKGAPRTTASTTKSLASDPAASSAADALFCYHMVQPNKQTFPIADRKDPGYDHGREIKTRQQLLDEQADAATTRAIGD